MDRIGAGALGSVFQFGDYAVKVSHTAANETAVLLELGHLPCCVGFFGALDSGELQDGQSALLLELCSKSVAAELEALPGKRLDGEDGRTHGFIAMCISSLAQLHARGLIHQDIKPSNLLIDKHGALKICDFNLSRQAHEPLAGSTPMYSSPALLRGEDDGYADDWWALGVTLYQMLHGLDTWPFAPAAALAALERQPPAQQLELVCKAVQRGRLRFRPLSGLPGDAKTLLRGLLHQQAAKRWGLLQVLAGDYPPGAAYAAVAAQHPALAPDMEHLLALRHLCRLSPAQLWCFHHDTQALAAQQPVIVTPAAAATTAAAGTAPPAALLTASASTGGGSGTGGSGGWAAAAEQALKEERRGGATATAVAAPFAASAAASPLKAQRSSLRALGSRIVRSMLSGGRRRSDDLSALHDREQPHFDQLASLPLAVQPRSPVLRPQPVGAALFGAGAAVPGVLMMTAAAPSSPLQPVLQPHHSSGSTGQADAFSLELARRRALAAIARVASLSKGSKKGGAAAAAVGALALAAPLVPRSERAVRSASASAAVVAAAAGLLTSDGQRLVVTSKFQPCEDHTPLIDVEALRVAVGQALEGPPPPLYPLLPPPPPRADSGSLDGNEVVAGGGPGHALRGRVLGMGSEAGVGLAGRSPVGAGGPATALRRCGTTGLDALALTGAAAEPLPPPTSGVAAAVKDGQVQDVSVLEEMRRLMMARRRSTAAGTKAAPPQPQPPVPAPAHAQAPAAALGTAAPAADVDKEDPAVGAVAVPAAALSSAALDSMPELPHLDVDTPDTARACAAVDRGAAALLQAGPAAAPDPPRRHTSAFAGSVVISTAAAAAAAAAATATAAQQPGGCSGGPAALDTQLLQSQSSQASTALYGLPSAQLSVQLPPTSPATPLTPKPPAPPSAMAQPESQPQAAATLGSSSRGGRAEGGGGGLFHFQGQGPTGISPLSCASRDGDGEVNIKLAYYGPDRGHSCKAQDCSGGGGAAAAASAMGAEPTAAQLAAELTAAARLESRRPTGVVAGGELVLVALAAQLAEQQQLHGALAVVHIGGGSLRKQEPGGPLPAALQSLLGPLPASASACGVVKARDKPPAAGNSGSNDYWGKPPSVNAPPKATVLGVAELRVLGSRGNTCGGDSVELSGGSGNGSGILTCSRTGSSGGTSLFSLAFGAATSAATAAAAFAGAGSGSSSEAQSTLAGGAVCDLADVRLHLEAEAAAQAEAADAEAEAADAEAEAAAKTKEKHEETGAGRANVPAATPGGQAPAAVAPWRSVSRAVAHVDVAEVVEGEAEACYDEAQERPTWGSAWSGPVTPGGGKGSPSDSRSRSNNSARRGLFSNLPQLCSISSTCLTAGPPGGSKGSSSIQRTSMRSQSRLSGSSAGTATAPGGLSGLAQYTSLVEPAQRLVRLVAEEVEVMEEASQACETVPAAGSEQPQPQPQPVLRSTGSSAAPQPQYHVQYVDVAPLETPRSKGEGVSPAAGSGVSVPGCGLASPLRWAGKLAARARGRVASVP